MAKHGTLQDSGLQITLLKQMSLFTKKISNFWLLDLTQEKFIFMEFKKI